MSTEIHRPVEFSLDQCIKCNICTTACPVSAVTGKFPGPKFEAPQAGRFRGSDQPTPDASVDYCSGCRVCNMVCPTGVRIAEINARARVDLVKQGKVPIMKRLRNNMVARAELLGKVAQPVAPLANAALGLKPARWIAEKAFGIAADAPLPAFSSEKFSNWFHSRQNPLHSERKVVYYHGCSTQYYEPRVGKAAVYVLEAAGLEVIVPPQNCCGLPLLSNGEFPAAQRYHESNVRHMVEFARQGIPIVGTSTSCTLTLKEEAPELLDLTSEDVRLVAEGVWDFNEFILNLRDEGKFDLPFKPLRPGGVHLPYHPPCQYRAHRLGKPGVEALELIPGLQIEESHASCCGIAGTYGYKTEKYQIAMDVGAPLFKFVKEFDSTLAICDSETCRWQITHGTGKPAVHPVELLAVSLGMVPFSPLKEWLAG